MDKRFPALCLGWMLGFALLSGCQLFAPEPEPEVVPPEEHPPEEPPYSLSEVVEQWLDEADRALSQDRLLEPSGDNAHDRYRAALYLDPGNTRAQSGLHAIVLRYLDMARSAARRGAFAQSRELLNRANIVDPGNPLVQALIEEVLEEQERQQQRDAELAGEDTFPLEPGPLSRRDSRLAEQLGELAERVRETGEFVLIISRTDDEGRWIYQQMQEAVPGFLVRGDIQIGTPPRVTLLPPL
ncbi:hypothetical protein [Marinimicrobium sp. ABcell2]|uniref:hypothetical protein n=1 Tax=Marinimicrobium sp. ABcell2 TaxID=3069751 RepID=UPI0027AEA735|nr:hypothetical protein [Marinimicrobium sp. ABcell2]MDQ2078230.1 hypothetical protein [Marinimicrobium sp. ABcell2]